MEQVTSDNKAEAECQAIIKRLAEMPCPTCEGEGQLSDYRACLCHGTGARFPWLRQRCPRCCSLKTVLIDPYASDETVLCERCNGTGWVPNYDIRLEVAIAEVLKVNASWPVIAKWYNWLVRQDASHPPSAVDVELYFWQTMEAVSQ